MVMSWRANSTTTVNSSLYKGIGAMIRTGVERLPGPMAEAAARLRLRGARQALPRLGPRRTSREGSTGRTLEVAVGTGLNLLFYPADVELTGIDFSSAMLGAARRRAGQLGRAVGLREADAQALPFPDACFDTAVCTFSLCAIPTSAARSAR
jgi:SAM-dependent methyltransferase